MRYTATLTIYIDAHNDKHAVSKAKMIAEREKVKYPNQDCAVEKIHSTPFASLDIREVDINKVNDIPGFEGTLDKLDELSIMCSKDLDNEWANESI